MNITSCLTWVRRGVPKKHPDRVKLAPFELQKLLADHSANAAKSDERDEGNDTEVSSDEGSEEIDESNVLSKTSRNENVEIAPQQMSDNESDNDFEKRYDMDNYDDGDNEAQTKSTGASLFHGKADPYMNIDESDDSEAGDYEVADDDNMIAVGKVSGEYCNLQVWIYNANDKSFYCHHDLMLPSFPLALEWLDFDPGEKEPGNLVAVGNMEPDIDIWDLDVIETVEPVCSLVGMKKRKKKMKKKTKTVTGHTDAVLDLSWNANQRNILASASADFTVGLWDLENGNMVSSITHHKEKVQSLEWHSVEVQMLLSGSFDHTAKIFDCRSPSDTVKSWTLPGEVERVSWNSHNQFYFVATTDNGGLHYMDVRTEKIVFSLDAHDDAVTGIAFSPSVPGCLVTGSSDKIAKVWDISSNKPKLVFEKGLKIGGIQCCGSNPDMPLTFIFGGEPELRVLNLMKEKQVATHFGFEYEGTDEINVHGDHESNSDVSDDEEIKDTSISNLKPKKIKPSQKSGLKKKNKKQKKLKNKNK